VEVLSALRRLVHAGEVLPERAAEAVQDLGLLRVVRHGHLDLATRAWELGENVTMYDAMYLALAESLDAVVITCDRPFSAAPGHSVRIEVIAPTPH
jgi:predicted nucleic acid-binding protein